MSDKIQQVRPVVLDYAVLQEFATKHNLDYNEVCTAARRAGPARPSDYVNSAGVLASDSPAEVVRKLDAAAQAVESMPQAQHLDDEAVDNLAYRMKAKLEKQREKGYGGWDTDCTQERLSELLRQHVDKGDPVDVANFCAFLQARGEGIAAPQAVQLPRTPAEGMPAQADEIEKLRALSVTNILLKVVPGLDGMGHEVHAKSVKEVEDALTEMAQRLEDWELGIKRLAATQPAAQQFQVRVGQWLMECFGHDIAHDGMERNHRFLEEALELVQSLGCTASEAHQLVDYVFGRPVGEPVQELGGVMVTLASLCFAHELDMAAGADKELARICDPATMAKIKAKQAAKPRHSPLPQPAAQGLDALTPAARDVLVERQHQISTKGYEPDADDGYEHGELAFAAATYAVLATNAPRHTTEHLWPWGLDSLKVGEPRRMLVKAGALIQAAIEREDRAAQTKQGGA